MFNSRSEFVIASKVLNSVIDSGEVDIIPPEVSHDSASDVWGIMMLPWHIMIFARTSTNWLTTVINAGAPFGGPNVVSGLNIIEMDASTLVKIITKFIDELNHPRSSRSHTAVSELTITGDHRASNLLSSIKNLLTVASHPNETTREFGSLPKGLKDELADYMVQLKNLKPNRQKIFAAEISQLYISADETELQLQELKNSLMMLMAELQSASTQASQHPDEKFPIHLLTLRNSISALLP